MKNVTVSDKPKLPCVAHRSIDPQDFKKYIIATENKILPLTQNNWVDIWFMKIRDICVFQPWFYVSYSVPLSVTP